jgi:hypothetical protein
MKKIFSGYYFPTDEEFRKLWEACLFVLDANVLLNLYRYSTETSTEIIEILKQISDRLWIPHQVGLEYHKNRLQEIANQEKIYDETITPLRKTQKTLKEQLLSKRHPFIKNADKLIKKIEDTFQELESNLKQRKDEYLSSIDAINEDITSLFEGKVGKAYSPEKLENIYKEGNKRYQQLIPPGYGDLKNKENFREYGDLILWFQIIDKTKNTKKPIIFVNDEKKDDWWLILKGEIIRPRPELIEEMLNKTGVLFHMYRVDPFMENAWKYLRKSVKDDAIAEVREVRHISEKELGISSALSGYLEQEANLRKQMADALGGEVYLGKLARDLLQQTEWKKQMADALGGEVYLGKLARDLLQQEADLRKQMADSLLGGVDAPKIGEGSSEQSPGDSKEDSKNQKK